MNSNNIYHRHRFPRVIISHCVWLYYRFSLSFRDIELMMAEKGIVITYESIRYQWYLKAANQGDLHAQFNLGFLYFTGQGIKQDYQQAYQWFLKAANQEEANAQYNLGVMYSQGF